MVSPMRMLAAAILVVAAGCGDRQTPTPSPAPGAQRPYVEHDFGMIPHGESRTAELEVPLPESGGPWVPVGFQRSCTCARHEFLVVGPDGSERVVAGIGLASPADAVPAGGSLRIRLTLDTLEKEAADLEPIWTPGQIVLQQASTPPQREFVPIRFRFGIEAPLRLVPFAHIDVGDVPRPVRYRQEIEIHQKDRPVQLGEPKCLEAAPNGGLREVRDLRTTLTPGDDGRSWILAIDLKADEDRTDGPFSFEIVMTTDLPGNYVLRVPVSGAIVPALQVSPPGWISFGPFPFDQPRECAVMVTDHDPERAPGFHVVGIVDNNGADLSEHFRARLEPVEEHVRSRTLHLEYLGGIEARTFRGEVLLAKEPDGHPILRIAFAGFDRR